MMLTNALALVQTVPVQDAGSTNAPQVLQPKHAVGKHHLGVAITTCLTGDFKLFANPRSISTWEPLSKEEELGSLALCSAAVSLPIGFCLL